MEQICANCKRYMRFYFKFGKRYRATDYGACTHGGIKKCGDMCYHFKSAETPENITAPPYTLLDDLTDVKERLVLMLKNFNS
ncbi:MAG: hypothetical protein FWH03_02810 [Firmicutes bacterium]|nr:hypothetical protein [Bacillota bacterium]